MENTKELTVLEQMVSRYPKLNVCKNDIWKAFMILLEAYKNNHKLLIAGNGGSAADSEHIVGELMKKFAVQRPLSEKLKSRIIDIDPENGPHMANKLEGSLNAISLVSNKVLISAISNDIGGDVIYAQQVIGYGRPGDVFLGITTSGNSRNIINTAVISKAMGMPVIGLTGNTGGIIQNYSDICIKVPENETYLIQELHLPIYHCWCKMLELHFWTKFENDRK